MDRNKMKRAWVKSKTAMETLLIVVFVANNLVATALVLEWAELPLLGDIAVGSILFAYATLYFIVQIYRGIDGNNNHE